MNPAATETKRPDVVIFTVATGNIKYIQMAKALAMSLMLHQTQRRRVIMTDSDDPELRELFDEVIPPPKDIPPFLLKLSGLRYIDCDAVLFLDADGLLFKSLDPIIDGLIDDDFAIQGERKTTGKWWGDMPTLMKKHNLPEILRVSGGFIYYRRGEVAETIIQRSLDNVTDYDSLGFDRLFGQIPDEPCISLAMQKTGGYKILSDLLGISQSPWTMAGKLQDLDVFRGKCTFVNMAEGHLYICNPYIYHTGMAKWDIPYWREVRKLIQFHRAHPDGFVRFGLPKPFHKRVMTRLTILVTTAYRKLFLSK